MIGFTFTIHRELNQDKPELRESYKGVRFRAVAPNCEGCPYFDKNEELDVNGLGATNCSAADYMAEGRHSGHGFDVTKVLNGDTDTKDAGCGTTITYSKYARR